MKLKDLRIDIDRLKDDIESLARIGASEDGGISRMAFTEADMQGRRWLIQRIQEAGLEGQMDGAANVLGHRRHRSKRPCVLTGSHLDSVPRGGHLDGALGVLASLECLRRLEEEGVQTRYPVEIVAFSDEEGRFGGLFGSRALCGELNRETILSVADLDGVSLTDAMESQGLSPMEALNARRRPQTLQAYLELHIEQGPVLDRLGSHIGIVEAITGLFRWSVRLIGASDHAGTTPMELRRDAFQGLAEFANEIPRVLEEHGGEDSVATIGSVVLSPGTSNVVPGTVEFTLDCRDKDDETLQGLFHAFRRALSAIARRRDLMFEFDILSEIHPESCDGQIAKIIEEGCKELGIEGHRMPSGAAHDAQIMAKLTRIGMIFVPSKNGRSHSPAEWTHWEDIEIGANLLLNTICRVAEAKDGSSPAKEGKREEPNR